MPSQTDLFTPTELAEYLNISPRTLIRWRNERRGPDWIRVGRVVRYRRQDVEAWLNKQRVQPVREVAA